MIDRRTVLGLIAAAGVIAPTGLAVAKQHHHKNGHMLLGAKLKQNGKHQIDKIGGKAAVTAEVNNGKVVGMAATDPQKGPLPFRKVKSNKKLAALAPNIVTVSAGSDTQMAQDVIVYYAWCFDDGIDLWCYWYPADVIIVDAGWVDYGPMI
jgi:hypothetical protein